MSRKMSVAKSVVAFFREVYVCFKRLEYLVYDGEFL